MQTFLPYPDFAKSAACLDRARLGKQRVEAYQLLRGQFHHHPASLMWRGYESALVQYAYVVIDEWVGRGYKDTVREKVRALGIAASDKLPPWFGDEAFHRAHRSKLYHKQPSYYFDKPGFEEFIGTEEPLPYIWPGVSHVP